MKFDIITLFPNMFKQVFSESIIQRAKEKDLIDIRLHQLRDYASDKHKNVDDTPCGGGPGMVLKVNVVDIAISNIKNKISKNSKSRTILLTPKGKRFTQKKAIELSKYDNLIFLCGHYEGFDQRVHDYLADEEISIGDYILTGGEIPAMVLIDAITRMIPGVIKEESIKSESFMTEKLKNQNDNDLQPTTYDYPNYTRPIEYKGWKVPEILLSGDHKKISEWRNNSRRSR